MRNFYIYDSELEGRELVEEIHKEEPDVPVVSHSQLLSWNRCEFQWYLGYAEGWTQREKSDPLVLGTLIHDDLHVWYRTRGSVPAVKQNYEKHLIEYGYKDDAFPLLAEEMWLMDQYMENFSPSNDRSFLVEATEEHFIFALWTPKGRKYYLQGYVDVRGLDSSNANSRWLWDHKTGQKFWTLTEFDTDIQLPLYAAAYTLNGMQVFGVLLNQLNTYRFKNKMKVNPEQLFRRDFNFLTVKQQANILTEVGKAVDSMIDMPLEYDPLYGDQLPRRRMSRDCKYCWFREPCFTALKGYSLQQSLEVNFRRKSDPPESRENYVEPRIQYELDDGSIYDSERGY